MTCNLGDDLALAWYMLARLYSKSDGTREMQGAIHSTKISGNFGPKLNGSVRSNRKSFEKTGPPFEVDHFSRSDRLEFWLNGRARNLSTHNLQVKYIIKIDRNQSKERTSIMLYPVMKILQLYFGYFEYILQSMFK